jgi:hypothetical protein
MPPPSNDRGVYIGIGVGISSAMVLFGGGLLVGYLAFGKKS